MNGTPPMIGKEGEEMSHKTRKEVIHTFQVNFFAMSLLKTFPWDVSRTLHDALMHY